MRMSLVLARPRTEVGLRAFSTTGCCSDRDGGLSRVRCGGWLVTAFFLSSQGPATMVALLRGFRVVSLLLLAAILSPVAARPPEGWQGVSPRRL